MTGPPSPGSYGRRLAVTYMLGLLGAFAWVPLSALIEAWSRADGPTLLLYIALLGLAPVPAIAAATLLVRDHGWRRGLLGAPAAILAVTTAGLWQVVHTAIKYGSFL